MWLSSVSAVIVVALAHRAGARGLMLLYRPRDISNDCVFSHHLRYDLSFGNGLSDTITLVFRTLTEIDYECGVEIVTNSNSAYLIVVIRFPNTIGENCPMNGDAFTVMKKNLCVRICDQIGDRDMYSPYFIISVRSRIRFMFLSNSSINSDMDANMYQVTATSARKKPPKGCNQKNESLCEVASDDFCFTSGVVCDGIKNCGVADWFDERKSDCELPVERIGHAPVVAVVALILCVMMAAGHLLVRFLPPLANSYFIFNANEDNRLCIDPVFLAPDYAPCAMDRARRVSVIPVSSSSSEEPTSGGNDSRIMAHDETKETEIQELNTTEKDGEEPLQGPRRKTTMRVMTEKLQQRLRAVAGHRRSGAPAEDP